MVRLNVLSKPLFIFDMANNHSGQVSHGIRISEEFSQIIKDYDFNFAFKLQYRYLKIGWI